MGEYLAEIIIGITSSTSAVGLTALCTWLVKSYRQFRRMSDQSERMAVSLSSIEKHLGDVKDTLRDHDKRLTAHDKRLSVLEGRA